MKFEKTFEYGPPKSAAYDTTVWAEATLQFGDWKECFQNDRPMKRFVFKDYYFVSSIWPRNNVRYSGMHRLNTSGEILAKTGVNLDNYEWINVMKKVEDINVALYGTQATQGEKRSSVNEVKVWGYKWLLNGEEVRGRDEESRCHSSLKYYSKEEARLRGSKHRPEVELKKEDELVMQVTSEYVQRPSELLQMRMILQHVGKACADINHEMGCIGCQNDPPAPGQTSHMRPGGCMYNRDFCSGGSDLTDDVYSVIEADDLITIYNIVCQKMDVPYNGLALMAKAIMEWLPVEAVADAITEEEEMFLYGRAEDEKVGDTDRFKECEIPAIAPENWALKYLICKAYYDVNMHAYLQKKLAEKKLSK